MAASPNTGLLRSDGRPVTRSDVLRAKAQANAGFHSHESASSRGTFMSGWNPWLRSADADWFFDRDRSVARTRDLTRNDAVAASASARKVNATVGSGWRLSPRCNARALGITPDEAAELRSDIETSFRHYAYGYSFQSDAERKKTFGQNLRLAAYHLFVDGEAVALIEWAGDEPTKFKTRMRAVDPDRLSNPFGRMDTDTLRRGVQRDQYGIPQGYWIREGHPNDVTTTLSLTWKYWPRYSTPLGRPQALHCFDETRAGQSRGVSRFVSVLKSLRAFSKFSDATLEKTTLSALWLAFVKSSAGPDAVSESLTANEWEGITASRREWYDGNPITIGDVRLPVLPPEDEIVASPIGNDNTGFDVFVRSVLRLVAAALGITYEELSMDFSQTNYSSARAALTIAWNETLSARSIISAQVATPFYVAWLEEAVDNGTVALPPGAPDFYDAIEAYSDCVWIGPARGYIDPTKEIDAAAARIEAGISTYEDECAEQGKDWRDVFQQRAIEEREREKLALEKIDSPLVDVGNDARDTSRDRDMEQRPQGSALARVHALARSPEHSAALDARPS